jgi:hypothetical protein
MTPEGCSKSQTRCDKLRPTTQWCCLPVFQPGSGDCDHHIGEDLMDQCLSRLGEFPTIAPGRNASNFIEERML